MSVETDVNGVYLRLVREIAADAYMLMEVVLQVARSNAGLAVASSAVAVVDAAAMCRW